MSPSIFITLLYGCSSSSQERVFPTGSVSSGVELTPMWTPDEVFDNLEILLAYGIPNPYPIMDRYIELYDEGGTEACPGTNYNFDGSDVDNAGCYAETGYFYAGLGELREMEDGYELQCDCRIVTPDGRMIRGAGNISVINEDSFLMLDIRGSFLEIKNDYEGTWLEELPSTSLTMMHGNGETFISGGYTINGISIYMENYMVDECAGRDDTLYIRDPSGGWWTWSIKGTCTDGMLAFQGTEYGTRVWDSQQFDRAIQDVLGVE